VLFATGAHTETTGKTKTQLIHDDSYFLIHLLFRFKKMSEQIKSTAVSSTVLVCHTKNSTKTAAFYEKKKNRK
jgi:hypothetical protein